MTPPPIVTTTAGALAEAARPALPRRKSKTHKPVPIVLAYERFTQALLVTEAKQGQFQISIALGAASSWAQEVIVDGVRLARAMATFPPEAGITLAYDDDALIVRCGGSCVRFNKIGGTGA